MSFGDKDYYQRLGISPDASVKEIKKSYKKLMLENHPDRFKGLKAKYEAEGDEVLLEVLEEKIRQADENCKFINEAYKALSDSVLRKAYDEKIYEPKVPVPEIVISPTKISFGTLNEGQRKSKSFTIENKGGPAVAAEIIWEDDPDWGELIIELDREEIFPIEVTIKVDTAGIPSGPKNQKILVKVDGIKCTVDVSLTLTQAYKPHPATAKVGVTPPPVAAVSHPTVRSRGKLAGAVLIGIILVCGFSFIVLKSALEQRQRQEILDNFPVEITEARRMNCVEYLSYDEDQRRMAEKKVGSDTICVIFTVKNEWEARASVEPTEGSGIHGDFYNPLVDPGFSNNPCGHRGSRSMDAGTTEKYVCFEESGTIVNTLCLNVWLRDPKAGSLAPDPYFLEKTICSEVVSIP